MAKACEDSDKRITKTVTLQVHCFMIVERFGSSIELAKMKIYADSDVQIENYVEVGRAK